MNTSETNLAALGRGLKLYTDAMRRLTNERLFAALNNNWWQYGVLDALTSGQRSSLNRELNKKSGHRPRGSN